MHFPFIERRKSQKLYYPAGANQPRLKILAQEFPVIDLSTGGIKFYDLDVQSFTIGQEVTAVLLLSGGKTVPVSGVIYREDTNGVVLRLYSLLSSEIISASGFEHRAYFRLRYPVHDRPKARLRNLSYEVAEISEKGIRICGATRSQYTPGEPLALRIVFSDGEVVTVEGQVLRFEHYEMVLYLTTGIPGTRVMQEQRNVLRKYHR